MTVRRTHRLVAQPLSPAAFAPYGVHVREPDRPPDWGASGSRIEGVHEGRAADGARVAELWNLGDLGFEGDVPYVGFVRYFHQGFRVAELERHPHETQTWLATGGTSFIVVAPATPGGLPTPGSAAAFVVEPGDLLALGRGVWMCHFFPLAAQATYALVTARRGPEQDRDLVNFAQRDGVVLEIALMPGPVPEDHAAANGGATGGG